MVDKNVMGKPRIGLNSKSGLILPDKQFMKPGELDCSIELIVREGVFNPAGKITNRIGPQRSESFTKQFLQMLFVCFAYCPQAWPLASVKDTSNTDRSIYLLRTALATSGCEHFNVTAIAADVTIGIIIGTGNTAPTITDYKIETIIPHATMNYGALTFGAPAADATTSQLTITRNFANVSGGAVVVNEIALYAKSEFGGGTAAYFCIIRDVIGGGVSVPNGQTLTVNYRPQAIV
jgi:hypothetical protein